MPFNNKIKNYTERGFEITKKGTAKGCKWVLLLKEKEGFSFRKSYEKRLLFFRDSIVKIEHFNEFCNRLKQFNEEIRFENKDSAIFLHTRNFNKIEYRNVAKRTIPDLYEFIKFTKLSKPRKSTKGKRKTQRVTNGPKIFIVHGHDNELKQEVARTVAELGLQPVILHEQTNRGRTIIEKFEQHASDVGYAIVILSPDDVGRSKRARILNPRARQNVVMELGFFIGKLDREKVFPLVRSAPNFERPSDISGIVYTNYDEKGAWRFKLCDELKACGYNVTREDLS